MVPFNKEKNKEQLEMVLPEIKMGKPFVPNNKKDSGNKKATNTSTALLIEENKKWLVKKSKS